jgi:phosphoribosylaminoimidazolecarboxamide formyltransferase/IMP cyclohydrolase
MKTTVIAPSRALISTFDKTGLIPLCQALVRAHVEIISTGNTARYLQEHRIPVVDVESITGFPEILDGRVKTLHPHIFAGLLARRNLASHIETLKLHEIDPIDLVVVNLYPFEKVTNAAGATESDCIENIDVGGPSLLRAASKNFEHVAVLSEPSQYELLLSQLAEHSGTTLEFRRSLAAAAFVKTAHYDQTIASWFERKELRYGENPHQKASVIVRPTAEVPLAQATPLQGKELSYNNLLDAHAAIHSLRWLMHTADGQHGAVVVKHGSPCGASVHESAAQALERAFASDPLSAFGGIVALSHAVDEKSALVLKNHFLEVVIAPAFSPEAREILASKKDLRLLEIPTLLSAPWAKESLRSIFGGYLVQDLDVPSATCSEWNFVSVKKPNASEQRDLAVANSLVVPCLSNAITLVRGGQLIGAGAGQTSRVDAVKLAIAKAREHGHNLEGASLASDAFFPFTDSLILAKEAGITSIIQPSGSKRDGEVIAKADELGLSLVFTNARHFRH